MKLHEYQAKEVLRRFGVTTPAGEMASTPEAAEVAADRLGRYPVAVKAQVHAGGRGKGGGIRLARSAAEAREFATVLLGNPLVTPQTGPEGRVVRKLLVEGGVRIREEFYVSVLVDRENAAVLLLASRAGGMNVEEAAEDDPEAMRRVAVSPVTGLRPYHLRELGFGLGLAGKVLKDFSAVVEGLYEAFTACDCTLVEVNPLVLTEEETFVALDAKIDLDDAALFRHPELAALQDEAEMDPLEAEAVRDGLNYIRMRGTVGNMVNGAGLAMATMDLIKRAGAEPANFLDVGGGASARMIEQGFRIILSDASVRGIFVNIFGGILRCDVLAEGLVEAARKVGLSVPVVVRMEGTNVEEGRRILAASGLPLTVAADLAEAVGRVASF